MDKKRIIIGIVAVGTLLPQLLGCIWGPGCLPEDTWVTLTADRTVDVGMLTAELTARANGSNTCGDEPRRTEIVEYRWDIDGDGIYEERGAELDRFVVTFDEVGEYAIGVEVEDSDGVTAQAVTTLEVLATLDPQDALDRTSVRVSDNSFSRECTDSREICAWITAPLDIEANVTIRADHDDGTVIEERIDGVALGPETTTNLCVEIGMAAADVTVGLAAGDAYRAEAQALSAGFQPDECTP